MATTVQEAGFALTLANEHCHPEKCTGSVHKFFSSYEQKLTASLLRNLRIMGQGGGVLIVGNAILTNTLREQ